MRSSQFPTSSFNMLLLSSSFWLLMANFLLMIPESDALQSWIEQPRYQEVNPSGSVIIPCKVTDKRGQCRWEKDGVPTGIFPKKYEWAGIPEKGDCSLKIINATLEFDDGVWQCQVTASSFNSKDALISEGAELVVRQSPESIEITKDSQSNVDIIASAGEEVILECNVKGGNPPSKIRWFERDEEILSGHNQENSRISPDSRVWLSVSKLALPVSKADNGAAIRCIAEHPTLSTPLSNRVSLTINYPPTVKIETSSLEYLEDNKDPAILRCVSDANPPAKVLWRKEGLNGIFSPDAEINIQPVTRHTAGVYSCTAENPLGLSKPAYVELDVKYGPSILHVGPSNIISAQMNRQTMLNCEAEGNPTPRYQWLQKLPTQEVLIRGQEKTLVIDNVTYDHQGEFVCKAINNIKGEERSVQSDPIRVEVSGAPQVMKYAAQHELRIQNGEDASLDVMFCADPLPKQAWHLGDLGSGSGNNIILAAGTGHGRFVAETVKKASKEDCYISSLRITGALPSDSHRYQLKLSNDHGSDDHTIRLIVRDQVSKESLIAVIAGAALTLVLLIVVCVYCCKSSNSRCNDNNSGNKKEFKPTDLESDRTDLESTHSSAVSYNGQNNISMEAKMAANKTANASAIPPDALYSGVASTGVSTQDIEANNLQNVLDGGHQHHQHLQQQGMASNGSRASGSPPLGELPSGYYSFETNILNDSKESLRPREFVSFKGQQQNPHPHHQQHQYYNHQYHGSSVSPSPRQSPMNMAQVYYPSQTQGAGSPAPNGHPEQHFPHPGPPRIVYNDLCNFPKTSNYGSMKKKKNKELYNAANGTTIIYSEH